MSCQKDVKKIHGFPRYLETSSAPEVPDVALPRLVVMHFTLCLKASYTGPTLCIASARASVMVKSRFVCWCRGARNSSPAAAPAFHCEGQECLGYAKGVS